MLIVDCLRTAVSARAVRCRWGSARRGPVHCIACADAVLSASRGGAELHLFGVQHGQPRAELGDFILTRRPRTVVVETAVNDEHGGATGNVLSLAGQWDGFTRELLGMARQIQSEGDDLHLSGTWQRLRSAVLPEHGAYIAALAVDARLLYGDEPKHTTLETLSGATAAELDRAFGRHATLNYLDMLQERSAALPPADRAALAAAAERLLPPQGCVVHRVMVAGRDAVLCASLRSALESARAGEAVVGVVGAAHLDGILALWPQLPESPSLAAAAAAAAAGPAQATYFQDVERESEPVRTPGDARGGAREGVRRALLERALSLVASGETAEAARGMMGPLPEEELEAYEATLTVWGSTRMLLAATDPAVLRFLVCGRAEKGAAGAAAGAGGDVQGLLEPLRSIRPANGGKGCEGFDDEVGAFLAFELYPAAGVSHVS